MKKSFLVAITLIAGLLSGCSNLAPDTGPLSLDQKLTREYSRYEKARELVVARYRDPDKTLAQQSIARGEWEALLQAGKEEAFTADDLNALKSRQKNRVAQARQAAIQNSLIDFSKWRALPADEASKQIRNFCEAVPKGGMLHIHPWGTLNQKTFGKLLSRSNPEIPVAALSNRLSDPQGLAYLYPEELAWLNRLPQKTTFNALSADDRTHMVQMGALPPGTHSFERFEAVFNFVALVMGGNWDNIDTAYDDFAARAVRAGVQYVEFTELIMPEDVPRYERLARRLQKQYGLVARFNVAFFRTRSVSSQNEAVKRMLEKTASPVIVGIDLLASERNAPALETGQAIYGPVLAANARGGKLWRRTMHAGEHGDARNPRDALLLGAERLGHGVRLIEDPVVLEYAAQKRIPVEINLISNLKLRALSDIRQHPYLTYLRLGLPVSLSTDDEGIYGTDINDECLLAVGQTDLTYHEFKTMAFNSLQGAFVSDEVKQQLLRELAQRFEQFEKRRTPALVRH